MSNAKLMPNAECFFSCRPVLTRRLGPQTLHHLGATALHVLPYIDGIRHVSSQLAFAFAFTFDCAFAFAFECAFAFEFAFACAFAFAFALVSKLGICIYI